MRALILGILLGLTASASAAPPTLTSLFPAGAQQGKTLVITAAGTFDPWPVQVWCDSKSIDIKPDKEKGKLQVTVAPDVLAGTYFIRLFNEQGASTIRPFIVGTLPELAEQEPNDEVKKAQSVQWSAVINGRLERTGDVDVYAIDLKKDQTFIASVLANRVLASPMDAVLQIVSADGFVLEQNNDWSDLDPQVVFTAPHDGRYCVRLFSFPATPDSGIRFSGSAEHIYRLSLTTGAFVDHAEELAISAGNRPLFRVRGWNVPKDMSLLQTDANGIWKVWHPLVANATTIRIEPHTTTVEHWPTDRKQPHLLILPITVTGHIEPAGDIDVFRFEAKKGDRLAFQLESRSLGFPLDAVLHLTDDAGKTIQQVDDLGSRRESTRDPELAFNVPQDGAYRLEVRDLHSDGGMRFAYRLRALSQPTEYELSLTSDRFTLTPGKPFDLAVTINRKFSYEGDTEVVAEDLPEGVTMTPGKSTKSSKTATVRLSAQSGPISGPFILKSGEKTVSNLWLTVLKPGAEPPKPPPQEKKKR